MKIVVDAMGGDNAPRAIVEGAVLAASQAGGAFELILVGDEDSVRDELNRFSFEGLSISVVPSLESIGMHETPTIALRKKKRSSIAVAFDLLKNNQADAVFSGGNTGAIMASAILTLRRLGGVDRPAIASFFPTEREPIIVLDVGANSDCRALNLYQFGVMGSIYVTHILGRQNPKVGLLSIGVESSKGNEITIQAHQLLAKSSLNFVGNIEGGDILKGDVDVIVCDGFVGNIILKLAESIDSLLRTRLREQFSSGLRAKLGAYLLQPALGKLRRELDYAEYGGAPLLGINGVCIIGHGGSSAKAVKNAILEARRMIEKRINEYIKEQLEINGGI